MCFPSDGAKLQDYISHDVMFFSLCLVRLLPASIGQKRLSLGKVSTFMLVNHRRTVGSETGGKVDDRGGFLVQKALRRQRDHNVLEKYGRTVYLFKETVWFYFEIRKAFASANLASACRRFVAFHLGKTKTVDYLHQQSG